MAIDTAQQLRFGVANEESTGLAGLALMAGSVKSPGVGRGTGGRRAAEAVPARLPGRADAAGADLQPVRGRGSHQRIGRLVGGPGGESGQRVAGGPTGGSLSLGVLRVAGLTASLVSFAESPVLLAELPGVGLDAQRVERAEALERAVGAAEYSGEAFATEPRPAPTMYLGIDGTDVQLRSSETADRAGKHEDGSAKTCDARLVTASTAESRHLRTDHPQRDPGSVSYCGAIESAASRDAEPESSAFARRVRREAERRRFQQAQRGVDLGDGAGPARKCSPAPFRSSTCGTPREALMRSSA